MKIAIIGAGISGLSCAYELEKNGIMPVVFEKKGFLGHQLEFSSIWPIQCSFTNVDCIMYLKDTLGLELTPLRKFRTKALFLTDKNIIEKGESGYIFRRGREPHSIEKQLASKLNAQIVLDSFIKIEDIEDSFDKIIVATGNNLIAKQYHLWTDTCVLQVRVATVLGNFDTGIINVWPDREYPNNAYCYLVPNDSLNASLIMAVQGITHHELYYCWDTFIKEESIPYCITEVRDAELFCGEASSRENERLYFIGNAGVFKDMFVGAGDFNSMLSGIYAARSIVENN